nr:NTP transferase domain-containing protein [uncultured Campylobacter sp.]
MQAIILAAGMGKRLKELTAHNTKCMIKVGGVTLIERMLRQIEKFGFSRIVIVEGYEGKKLKDFIATLGIKTPIKYINNPIYNKTNNIYSLSLATSELVSDDSVLFESDLIFEDSVIETLLADPEPNLALVDKYENWMDGTCLILGQNDEIKDFVPSSEFCFANKDKYYKTVNIYKFSKEFCQNEYLPFLTAYRKALGDNEYYEQVLKVIIMLDNANIKAKRLDTQSWYEIDDKQDLDIASSIFSKDKKAHLVQMRYGGYWRYPKLLDFSYLVNPYFPPQRLIDEIKANFENLLINYPSGEHINALLASKNFDIKEQNIVVGNGASELIKSVLSYLKGKKLGVIKPSFEEYANRALGILEFHPHTSDFSYNASDIISFFNNKKNLSTCANKS